MLTWAVFWFCAKTKSDPNNMPLFAMVLNTVALVCFSEALK